jgi:hypothetical protein
MAPLTFIDDLDAEWDTHGFLGQLRLGNFVPAHASRFLQLLRQIEIPDDATVPKRALALIWYLPTFLIWQRERVMEKGGNVAEFDRFVTEVHNTLEDVIGIP